MIELASVIRDLRVELEQAVVAADGAALRFELGPIELEVSVALEREAGSGTKVRFWVVQAGADGKIGTTNTQRVKLTLTPRLAPDDRSPYVSGEIMPGEE
ncbi:trypco2 family protein [Catenulispora rubra]|uniref:trypco2 family protein n=1 Tax=Catenulispora rubra TaxID=280293 RepID=UPI0018928110|nr:trypco2 family protein [Catenulispora rubra]